MPSAAIERFAEEGDLGADVLAALQRRLADPGEEGERRLRPGLGLGQRLPRAVEQRLQWAGRQALQGACAGAMSCPGCASRSSRSSSTAPAVSSAVIAGEVEHQRPGAAGGAQRLGPEPRRGVGIECAAEGQRGRRRSGLVSERRRVGRAKWDVAGSGPLPLMP